MINISKKCGNTAKNAIRVAHADPYPGNATEFWGKKINCATFN